MGPRNAVIHPLRLIALGAGVLVTAVLLTTLPGTPAAAEPTVAEIEAQIKAEWNGLEPKIEQQNKIKSDLAANRKKQSELEQALKPLELQVSLTMAKVGGLAAASYKAGSPSPFRILLSSESSNDLMDRLALVNQISRQQLAEISGVTAAREKYGKEKKALDSLVDQLGKQESELATKRKEIETKIADLQQLRRKVYGAGGTGPLRPVACPFDVASGPGTAAATKACAQIGADYVYGAAGPSTFDCSGLTQFAWAGSSSLPHNAAGQYSQITHVARADLRPGDLVFYYSPIHHVAIYVGGDWVVHAPSSGDQVRMAKVDQSAKAVGFGRPG